jgi:hypothetical protein
METFPRLWDATCSDYVFGTDTSAETALRALEEDLGVIIDEEAMKAAFVCTVPCEASREFVDIYVPRLGPAILEEPKRKTYRFPFKTLPTDMQKLENHFTRMSTLANEKAEVALRTLTEVFGALEAEDAGYVPRAAHYRAAVRSACEKFEKDLYVAPVFDEDGRLVE